MKDSTQAGRSASMKPVYLVSYPRSGQHDTQGLLEQVSGQDDYCELHGCRVPGCAGNGLPIEQRMPCPAGRRIQKNHDFDLQLQPQRDALYAVLYRRPLYSIASYFELDTKDGYGVPLSVPLEDPNSRKEPGATLPERPWYRRLGDWWSPPRRPSVRMRIVRHPETQESWERHAIEKAAYWRGFVQKWVALGQARNVHLVRYESIVSDTDTARARSAVRPAGAERGAAGIGDGHPERGAGQEYRARAGPVAVPL